MVGSQRLTIDLSTDGLSHNFVLSSSGMTSTLHDTLGNLPQDITYITTSLSSLTIDTSSAGNEVLNVDFSGGNPIPIPTVSPTVAFPDVPSTPAAGLIFNAGADFGNTLSHALNLSGTLPSGAFASEIHNANDHSVFPQIGQYGSIDFVDSSSTATGLDYTGLLPINDTTPAVDYTFNDFADDQSFTASDGPAVMGFNTIQFANTPSTPPPTFETTNVANKTNITFNTTVPIAGINGVVNIPMASTGLATLTFNTPTRAATTTGQLLNTPPGVVTTLNGGTGERRHERHGQGVAAGTTLFLNGGAGVNTLNYDAGGLNPTVTPGCCPVRWSSRLPGFGSVDVTNYGPINITDVTPLTITPGAARSRSTASRASTSSMPSSARSPLPIPPIRARTAGLARQLTSPRRSTGATRRPTSRPARSPRTRATRASTTLPARIPWPRHVYTVAIDDRLRRRHDHRSGQRHTGDGDLPPGPARQPAPLPRRR